MLWQLPSMCNLIQAKMCNSKGKYRSHVMYQFMLASEEEVKWVVIWKGRRFWFITCKSHNHLPRFRDLQWENLIWLYMYLTVLLHLYCFTFLWHDKNLGYCLETLATIYQFMTADENLNSSLYQCISEPEALLHRMMRTDSAGKHTTQWRWWRLSGLKPKSE